MIQVIPKGNNIYHMKIEMHIPQEQIFEFLQKRGYEIIAYLWNYGDETFPNGKTKNEVWTFTATKANEIQSEEALYLSVFENELKQNFQGYGLP